MNEQPVIWMVELNDRTQIREIDENGKETIFNEALLSKKADFRYIALLDLVNDLVYTIDLLDGHYILRGQIFNIAKEADGRIFSISNRKELNYRDGVIQFKCSKPVELKMGQALPSTVKPATFNIGFKVDIPDGVCTYHKSESEVCHITKCQTLISINSDTLQPYLAITMLAKIINKDGSVRYVKL